MSRRVKRMPAMGANNSVLKKVRRRTIEPRSLDALPQQPRRVAAVMHAHLVLRSPQEFVGRH